MPDNLSSQFVLQCNKCAGIKSVDNSILLNRLYTAMITVLDMGSNLLFGVHWWKRAGPLYYSKYVEFYSMIFG